MRSGSLLWDHAIDIGSETSFLMKNAPLIVKDKAIIGLAGYGGVERGSFILAVNLETGARFPKNALMPSAACRDDGPSRS